MVLVTQFRLFEREKTIKKYVENFDLLENEDINADGITQRQLRTKFTFQTASLIAKQLKYMVFHHSRIIPLQEVSHDRYGLYLYF